jgi:hypothetical protein
MFMAKDNVLKGMSIHLMRERCEPKLCRITISVKGVELSKTMRGIGPRAHKGFKGERFGGDAGEDIKGMGRDNFREARDYSNAVPGIRGLKEGSIIGQRGRRKSRGRFRT